jgi:two-component system phosphate regulon sensor histidine kinase PhoR
MRGRRLFWQLFLSVLLLVVVALAGIGLYVSRTMREFMVEDIAAGLRARAELIASHLARKLGPEDREEVQRFCRRLGEETGTRITVILPTGEVVGESERAPETMENHADRPEIIAALREGYGQATRLSPTLQQDMMYVAVPIEKEGTYTGVARTSMPLTAIQQSVRKLYAEIAFAGLLVAILVALAGLLTTRAISRPLEEMQRGAERFAEGDLKARLAVPGSSELRSLAQTLNHMAAELDGRIETITRERNEHEAILSSMSEGVLAVDEEQHVLSMNRAARAMLDVTVAEPLGRLIQEVVRNADLQGFVVRSLSSEEPVEEDVTFRNDRDRLLEAHGAALRDAAGQRIGAVIVLNDVTRIRRLESVRRDFVANVSHELKTPITSIKGFVETLRDGALGNPEEAGRFLEIIGRHADRLTAIMDDLLVLSRIEQDAEGEGVPLERVRLSGVLRSAVRLCETKRARKDIQVDVQCPRNLELDVGVQLLEQAVANLVDNAIKYSEAGSAVEVRASEDDGEVAISVEDHGCGIAPHHLSRLFERFYRVDKGRSRELGGTGLGLAIVKHIVQAHHGSVSVNSRPGHGSTFTIRLPRDASGAAAAGAESGGSSAP